MAAISWRPDPHHDERGFAMVHIHRVASAAPIATILRPARTAKGTREDRHQAESPLQRRSRTRGETITASNGMRQSCSRFRRRVQASGERRHAGHKAMAQRFGAGPCFPEGDSLRCYTRRLK